MASALHAISTPYSTSVSVPLYAITARSIATPYSTSVSVPLYAITARSITNQRTSSGIGFTFLPHVIIPDKRHGVHWCNTDHLPPFRETVHIKKNPVLPKISSSLPQRENSRCLSSSCPLFSVFFFFAITSFNSRFAASAASCCRRFFVSSSSPRGGIKYFLSIPCSTCKNDIAKWVHVKTRKLIKPEPVITARQPASVGIAGPQDRF